ncbi:deoxyhypusine synthase [candidate division MSBL1 archaeon SCGC-AAA261G05]|uniref:Probable deoxyhypusine synthase n=2 Tax=candidate division MSBL1 TaxID=215777 RepID=A0A133V1K7_9EURY|nr:deoxyhypusine synthase [candidate division MSBL1 archaeon SCGC-AAA261C02]KXB04072.1 deoxyhypusine synthase [candidate division MSBL1 archaeon SCGC-AAA261G05]
MKKELDRKVEDVDLRGGMSLDELVQELEAGGGFTGKKVGVAVDILGEMVGDDDSVNFLSFPACIVATGCRGVIRDLVKEELVDVIVTTCGTLDHDLARSWSDYYHGDFNLDDVELHQEKINRIGNVLAPNESYGLILEEKMQPILNELYEEKQEFTARELAWEFGKRLGEDSILYWAQKNEIPVFVPGLMDGAFGSQLWLFWQEHRDFRVNPIQDEEELSEIVFNAEKSGGLIVGGGISKHHALWWNSFKDGLDYAVYITTAQEYDGSLSGAKPREAVSWGKIKEKASKVTVEGDATVLLPLIVGALIERL